MRFVKFFPENKKRLLIQTILIDYLHIRDGENLLWGRNWILYTTYVHLYTGYINCLLVIVSVVSIILTMLHTHFYFQNFLWMKKQDRQFTYKRNNEARSRNCCCSEKAMSITYYGCVCAVLVIQHAKRMRRIILSSVPCLALTCFSILSNKRHDFRKNVIGMKYVFWFSLQFLSEKFTKVFMQSTRYFCYILRKTTFSRHIFEKSSKH